MYLLVQDPLLYCKKREWRERELAAASATIATDALLLQMLNRERVLLQFRTHDSNIVYIGASKTSKDE